MSLPTINLDDRTFQEIVDQALERIPRYCPEWTDLSSSDPGVTLIELFAWMMEMMLYRLNRVPEKHLIKLLELIGVTMQPPQAATTDVSFTLTKPATNKITIPRGTEVSTGRTGTEDSIIFSTEEDLEILPAQARSLWCEVQVETERSGKDISLALERSIEGFHLFSDPPHPGEAMYIGLGNPVANHILTLTFEFAQQEETLEQVWPWIVWQAWGGQELGWLSIEVESGDLGNKSIGGGSLNLRLNLPAQLAPRNLFDTTAYWVRGVVQKENEAKFPSPLVQRLFCQTIGASVSAVEGRVVAGDELGRSNGRAGQTFHLSQVPVVMPLRPEETVEVEEDGMWKPWQFVLDFAASNENDRHFTCDPISGEICFGPAFRQADRTLHYFGRVPPEGGRLRMSRYRTGGGPKGNVGTAQLNVLTSSIPYVAAVTNPKAARGGRDRESVEYARLRGLRQWRAQDRAVTAEDFETLALQVPGVARAHCIPVRPTSIDPAAGSVRLLLVPDVGDARRPNDADLAVIGSPLAKAVEGYLDERRLLCTRLEIAQPEYVWVTVDLEIEIWDQYEPAMVEQRVNDALYEFLNPIRGGLEGTGWPFGHDLYIADIYALLQKIPGVRTIIKPAFRCISSTTRRGWEEQYHVSLLENQLIASTDKLLTFIRGDPKEQRRMHNVYCKRG